MIEFFSELKQYFFAVMPALAIGFFLSGLVHELVPSNIVERYLGGKGIRPILRATLVGAILPICCVGSLPVAIAFYRKGARTGPVFAFLVATPATSITALSVCYRLLGSEFAVYIFFAVIIMGVLMGLIANSFKIAPRSQEKAVCSHCGEIKDGHVHEKGFKSRLQAIVKFGFVDMVKDIGPQIVVGLVLAAAVGSYTPLGQWIRNNLVGFTAYVYSLVFGLFMYICSTATVPLADALIKQGLVPGAAMVLLIAGPVTSYSTIFVMAKEFGFKILGTYLLLVSVFALGFGYLFS